jgi:hypothetical protein
VHWLVGGTLHDSTLKPKAIERAVGGLPHTTRNMTMLAKLSAKMVT